MRISDLRSDVCSSDLSSSLVIGVLLRRLSIWARAILFVPSRMTPRIVRLHKPIINIQSGATTVKPNANAGLPICLKMLKRPKCCRRSEEHTSELQSLMRISYAVFCLKKKNNNQRSPNTHHNVTKISKPVLYPKAHQYTAISSQNN